MTESQRIIHLRNPVTHYSETSACILRDAMPDDAPAISAIYAHYVHTSPATFEQEAPDAGEIRARLAAISSAGLPWRVALDADRAVAGYAYAALYRTRTAYRYTVENSVYVAPGALCRGIGSALMRDLIARCAHAGFRQMLAVIGDSANDASISLHAKLGFEMIGIHRAVGFKFGRWIDVVHMQLALGDGARSLPAQPSA
jgi:L-amino acid N-acyltransferase YncA